MTIIYLDQNKWIEIAQAIKDPIKYRDLMNLIERISDTVRSGGLMLPLTSTNIYETYKIHRHERRQRLALVQCKLSRGLVIRGRAKRKTEELRRVLASCIGLEAPVTAPLWFLSTLFAEAFVEWNAEEFGLTIPFGSSMQLEFESGFMLYSYLVDRDEEMRRRAVKHFSEGSERLVAQIEERRTRNADDSDDLRRKIYSALLLVDDTDLILRTAGNVGACWRKIGDIDEKIILRIIEEVPSYYIEREIALRLEVQKKAVNENDLRDMLSYCASIPYVDMVIGEKNFINMARQSGLEKRFETRLETDIRMLQDFVD